MTYNTSELADYRSQTPFLRIAPGATPNVNVRDAIRRGDESQTPAQFVYEKADCRLFYTAEMKVDISAMWKGVVDAAWGEGKGGSKCLPTKGSGDGSRTKGDLSVGRKAADVLEELTRSLEVVTDLERVTLVGDGLMLP